ncbi:MAG: type IV pilus modification protein PilV [Comamonas sp.]
MRVLKQRGITLIESLVAIVVMALGVLGVLGVQMRTLADTQTGVRRAQAVRLIEDLSERIRVNPNGLSQLTSYVINTAEPAAAPGAAELTALQALQSTCTSSACSGAQLASRDRALWLATVQQTLPQGHAQVFLVASENTTVDRRQLGVMVSWRENEKTAAAGLQPPSSVSGGVSCPATRSCHVQYIQPGARCLPYGAGGLAQVICPD